MMWKALAMTAVLAGVVTAGAQTGTQPATQAPPPTPAAASQAAAAQASTGQATAGQATAGQSPHTDCATGPCDYQPPHITIATPAPAPAPWPLQDRITWVTQALLALLGYAGILIALAVLRKIERQTRLSEEAAQAAAESAQAALLHTQALVRAERPWVLVAVENSRTVENSFAVVASNRGRSPARIQLTMDAMTTAADEEHLPSEPEYGAASAHMPAASMILLPGESLTLKSFGRSDVKGFCGSAEKLKRVEEWEEKIYLYGKIEYFDLIAPAEEQRHETGWCCWYIHGRQKSGMVMAGPPAYNRHS